MKNCPTIFARWVTKTKTPLSASLAAVKLTPCPPQPPCSLFPGFVKVKMVHTRKGISAFVEYSTVEEATEALKQSQHVVLKSSAGRGPIRVQFSKNPMGSRDYGRMMYAPMAAVQLPPGVPAGPHIGAMGAIGAIGHMPGMYFVPSPDMPFPNPEQSGPGAEHASNEE